MEVAAPVEALRSAFIAGMGHAACTVNIITTDGPAGRAGVTVSAMSSVSADTPRPTLLVCVHHLSPAAQKLIDNGAFCVNLLRDDQGYISDTFAGRFSDAVTDKFDCADWSPMPSGCPRVIDPLVAFDCTIVSSERVGTHFVFFGEVNDIFIADSGSPLIYANRSYGTPNRIESASSIAAGRQSAESRLSVGCFHTFGPFVMPEMIQRMVQSDPGLEISLIEGDQRRVRESLLAGETELALLYDLDLPGELHAVPLIRLEPYVLLAEGDPLAARAVLKPEDLTDRPMVLLDVPPSRDYFLSILRVAGCEPQIAHRSSSIEMVRGLVGHGLGYALLTTKPAASMTYDGRGVISRPLQTSVDPSRVVLARRKGIRLSGPAERFMWFCHDFFGLEE